MYTRWRATSVLLLGALLTSYATAAFFTQSVRAQAASSANDTAQTWTATPAPLTAWTPAPTAFGMTDAAVPVVIPIAPDPSALAGSALAGSALAGSALPAGCVELNQNGGFEAGFAGWVPGPSQLPPAVVTTPVLSDLHAAGMGAHPGVLSGQNLNYYSSIRQTVTVPWGYARTVLTFWTYTWAESAAGRDRQQFVLLGPGNVVWAIPWRTLDNAQAWQQHIFEIIGVGGQTFDLYFGVVNDGKGGRTALFIDQVQLLGCAGDVGPLAASQMQAGDMLLAPTPQATPAPQIYSTATEPALIPDEGLTGARGIETLTTPSAQWTVVAIGTVFESSGSAIAPARAVGTPAPLAEVPAGAAALLGTVIPELPSVTVSVTPQPASSLSNLTARWPPNWPLVIIGIIVVAIIILLIVRARQDRIGTP